MIIYKTTNIVNGKIYIGQDSKNNPKYLGSGLVLQLAIKKYGQPNFIKEILEFCDSKEQLDIKEKYWIKTLDSQNPEIGYNIKPGGDGGDTLSHHKNKEAIYKKISATLKSNKRTLTEEQKQARRDYRHTDEAKQKMSVSRKGKTKSSEHLEKLRLSNIKTYQNQEIRDKISNSNLGKRRTDEQKKKISNATLSVEHTNSHITYFIMTPENQVISIVKRENVYRQIPCGQMVLRLGEYKGYKLLKKTKCK